MAGPGSELVRMGRLLIEGIPFHVDTMGGYVGKPLGESDWMPIDQNRIDLFSEATEDRNPLHVDPGWAEANGPFGGTVAHGFLTLSLLSHLSRSGELQPDGVDYGINLGFERIRFLAPVAEGDRIRLRLFLMEIKPRGPGKWQYKLRCTVVTEKTGKTALSAVWLVMFVSTALTGEEGRPFG